MEIKIKLRPFLTPNYVLCETTPMQRQDVLIEAPKWHVSDIDAQVLSDLCDQFRKDVFKKANKIDPLVAKAANRRP